MKFNADGKDISWGKKIIIAKYTAKDQNALGVYIDELERIGISAS